MSLSSQRLLAKASESKLKIEEHDEASMTMPNFQLLFYEVEGYLKLNIDGLFMGFSRDLIVTGMYLIL